MPVSLACVALYTQIQPLYLSAPLGGTKGKSMGLLWSGAKAVIKRYRRQSHTQHKQWKSFACTTLIFTPSVTHLSLCLPLSPSLCFFVSPIPTPLPPPLKIDSCIYILRVMPLHMYVDT